MSSNDAAEFDAPPSPPPPAYELSQYEFDRKTSHVLQHSATLRIDDDGFEVWDDALFESARAGLDSLSLSAGQSSQSGASHPRHPSTSNQGLSSSSSSAPPPAFPPSGSSYGYPPEKGAARLAPSLAPITSANETVSLASASSGSQMPTLEPSPEPSFSSAPSYSLSAPPPHSSQPEVRPLRVTKKTRAPRKERPAWYAEAGLGGNSPPPSPLQSQAGSSSSRSDHVPLRRGLTVFNHTERDGTPPPEFTAVGPVLDGPPYDAVVLTYEGPQDSINVLLPPPSEPYPTEARASPAPSVQSVQRMSATPRPQSGNQPAQHVQPQVPLYQPQHAASVPDPAHVSRHHHPPPHAQTYLVPAPSPPVQRQQPFQRQATASPSSTARPSTTYGKLPAGLMNGPRLSFNPQSAYAKSTVPTLHSRMADAEPQMADASAFYSNAVSAHYSYNVPARARRTSYFEQPSNVPSQLQQQGRFDVGRPLPSVSPTPSGKPASVASPRPNYGYSQANFQESAFGTNGAWGGYNGQPTGGSYPYR